MSPHGTAGGPRCPSWVRAWLFLIVLVLTAGSAASASSPALALAPELLNRGVLSSGQLLILMPASGDRYKILGSCSGTVVDSRGLILTDYHCVGLRSMDREDPSGQGLKPGQLFNPKGIGVWAPTLSAREAPKPTYFAQFVTGNADVDVAVLKIVGMVNERESLPSPLPLVVQPQGDSDSVQLGDRVYAIGYPGVGGNLVTLTTGIVSGFDDLDGDGQLDSIKTDANISHGNSGGLALNEAGEQVGIPAWGIEEGASQLARMIAINVARPYVQQAASGASAPTTTPPQTTQPQERPPVSTEPGTVLTGLVADADTGKPIPATFVGVLKPGVTADQFFGAPDGELIVARGVSGASGLYRTAPAIARGQAYSIVVGADGYEARGFDDVRLPADAPGVIELSDVALRRL